MLTYDEMKLVAEGCYRPSNDQRVRAMVKLIEDIVFPEHVFSYSEEEMLNALMRKLGVQLTLAHWADPERIEA